MRKWLLLLISFCYLASSSGVAVQWHYCMGKLRSVAISFSPAEDSCSKCGMKKKANSCCNDAVNISKLTDDHQQSNLIAFDFLSAAVLATPAYVSPEPSFVFAAENIQSKIYPPPGLPNNRIVLFCVFRC